MSGPDRGFADSGLAVGGALLLLAGGLCTGGFIASFNLPHPIYLSAAFSQAALIIGAFPVLAGAVMILIGVRAIRRPPSESGPPP